MRFRVTVDLASAVDCNCSICRKKGILHLIVPPEQFELLRGKDDLTHRSNRSLKNVLALPLCPDFRERLLHLA